MSLRVAFVGFRHGHVQSIYKAVKALDYAEIVGVVEEECDANQYLAGLGLENTHNTFDDLLDDVDFDLVCCGDYYAKRGEVAIKSLRAGRHFHTDKPLCTDINELREMKRLCQENNVEINVHLSMRYRASSLTMLRAIQDGHIGKFLAASSFGQHPLGYPDTRPHWYFEEGKHGGTINDLWIHGADLLRWITDLEFETVVSAECWNARLPEVPFFQDGAQCLMTMEGGPRVLADISYMPGMGWQFFISAEEAYMITRGEDIIIRRQGQEDQKIELATADDIPFPSPLHDFASHLEFGTERWLSMDDCFKSTMAMLTAQKCGDTGERDVPIPQI